MPGVAPSERKVWSGDSTGQNSWDSSPVGPASPAPVFGGVYTWSLYIPVLSGHDKPNW